MRAVFVNHCHPETPHVCALRMREFANAMAARGHRIVLLTETLNPGDEVPSPEALGDLLRAHDWARPFRLACRPVAAPLTARLQARALPAILSKPTALWCYLAKGGVFWTWTAGSRPYWRPLAAAFRPDCVWATFGNVDALNIARGIARIAGCPWVMDVKDYWSVYLPAPLRAAVARRYRDAAGRTAQSATNRDEIAPWFPAPATIVRSGFPAAFLAPAAVSGPEEGFRLMLTGSVYDAGALETAIDGFARWLAGGGARGPAVFAYAGGDHARVRAATARLAGLCAVEIEPFLPLEALFARQRRASANLYLKARTFHHKLIELVAARRPVIAFPGEEAEARDLAAGAGLPLYPCENAAALAAALDEVRRMPAGALAADMAVLERMSWTGQAEVLDAALLTAIKGAGAEISGQPCPRAL